jgi:hypothetical protein
MLTTPYFEETIYDEAEQEDRPVCLEFGIVRDRMGDDLIYVSIDGRSWRFNRTLSRQFCLAIAEAAARWLASNPKRRGRPPRELRVG